MCYKEIFHDAKYFSYVHTIHVGVGAGEVPEWAF